MTPAAVANRVVRGRVVLVVEPPLRHEELSGS